MGMCEQHSEQHANAFGAELQELVKKYFDHSEQFHFTGILDDGYGIYAIEDKDPETTITLLRKGIERFEREQAHRAKFSASADGVISEVKDWLAETFNVNPDEIAVVELSGHEAALYLDSLVKEADNS